MLKGLQRALTALFVSLTLYTLLGFLIVPGIALRVANQQLAEYATVPARLERIELNPFTLELSLWGLHIGEPAAEKLGFGRLYLDLQWDSLWRKTLHLRDIELEKATVNGLRSKDGQLNLAQLFKLPESDPAAADEPPSPLPAVSIERIALIEGSVHFQDQQPKTPFELVYDSLNLELHNLTTLPDDNAELSLSARGPQGGELDWKGTLSVNPLNSKGHLTLQNVQLKAAWPYVREQVPLDLADGVLHVATDYRLALGESVQLNLDQLSVKLEKLALQAPDQRPLLNLASLEISESSLDLAEQKVILGKIRSQQLETWAAREADGELDWQKLFTAPATAPATEPTASAVPAVSTSTSDTAQTTTDTSAATETPNQPWQILLRDGQLQNYSIHLADRAVKPELKLEVTPLNLSISDFDSLGTSPFKLKLDTGLGKQGKLAIAGDVQLSPISANLQVQTSQIDLRVAQAYISPFVRLELRSGQLGSDLAVKLASVEPLDFSISGNAKINQLHTLDTVKERDFLRWQQLKLDGLDYQHGQQLSIAKVAINQPYVRFIVNENLTTNVSELLIPQPPSTAPVAAENSPPLGILIGGISLNDGSANFADFSLTPDFATAIQQLNGNIGTIDSRSPKPASVNIQGKIDRYAPVSIKGSLNPFDPLDSLDIATSFKRVELTTLTPYSGKFAGYRIKKGRLNLDLNYKINKGQLNAENKLVLEQLQLGEQVDSPDAVDLPIRLAVALLKDSDGKIDIELPISGDLNNPEFSVAPIVWQTLRNLLVRAVQAPFNFIAGLVSGGSDVDLSQVPFSAGSSELEPAANETLDTLAKALKERPALRLEVQGVSAKDSDGPLLAKAKLNSELQSTWYKIMQRQGESLPEHVSELIVPEDEQPALLAGIYRTRLKQQPPAEWADLDDEVRADNMRQALLKSWGTSSLLQRKLAQARGASVKEYLVQSGGLSDERIYLVDVDIIDSSQGTQVDTHLNLDSE